MTIDVLIIDDEVETCRMLATALGLFGYAPRTALSGAEALEIAAGQPPDVGGVGFMMPGMDGFEVAQRMRSSTTLQHVPIIVVTAIGDVNAEEKSMAAGATAFLRKPVSISALAEVIRRVSATQ